MTLETFLDSIASHDLPPPGLSQEAQALWHAKKGHWEASHNIAQEIHTPLGSWIHALLHLIEGDVGNANYWFAKSGKNPVKPNQIDPLWDEITTETLSQE